MKRKIANRIVKSVNIKGHRQLVIYYADEDYKPTANEMVLDDIVLSGHEWVKDKQIYDWLKDDFGYKIQSFVID